MHIFFSLELWQMLDGCRFHPAVHNHPGDLGWSCSGFRLMGPCLAGDVFGWGLCLGGEFFFWFFLGGTKPGKMLQDLQIHEDFSGFFLNVFFLGVKFSWIVWMVCFKRCKLEMIGIFCWKCSSLLGGFVKLIINVHGNHVLKMFEIPLRGAKMGENNGLSAFQLW